MARHSRLRIVANAFSRDKKIQLLSLVIPEDVLPEIAIHEQWDRRLDSTIEEMFMNRFDTASIDILNRVLEGSDSNEMPNGMVSIIAKVEAYRESIKDKKKELDLALERAAECERAANIFLWTKQYRC